MPPPLAACLIVGFILFLFRRSSTKSDTIPYGMWVSFVWLAIISSRPVGYWFASGTVAAAAEDPTEGSFIDRNVYLFLIVVGLIVLARRRVDWRAVLNQNRWLWIFYLYLLISVVWSEYPVVAFKRWFKDVGNVVMVLIILTEKNPVGAIRWVFIRCAYLLVPLSVLFIKWYPDLGRYYHKWTYQAYFCGIALNKNELGVLVLVCGLFMLWQIVDMCGYPGKGVSVRDVWPDLLVLFMCLWILATAQCATALSCFVIGAAVFFASRLDWVRTNLRRLSWCALGVAVLMLAFTAIPEFREVIANTVGRDVTLTGRTVIWEEVLKLKTNPLIGSGFASAWLTQGARNMVEEIGGSLSHAHNGYLETYLHTGWIGVCLLLTVLLSAGQNASRQLSARSVVGNLYMGLFLSGLLYNYTEVAFNTSNVIGFCLWLMAARYRTPVKVNRLRKEEAYDDSRAGLSLASGGGLANSGA